jgi:hypothetical protein
MSNPDTSGGQPVPAVPNPQPPVPYRPGKTVITPGPVNPGPTNPLGPSKGR